MINKIIKKKFIHETKNNNKVIQCPFLEIFFNEQNTNKSFVSTVQNLNCPIQKKSCPYSTLFGKDYICKIKLDYFEDSYHITNDVMEK